MFSQNNDSTVRASRRSRVIILPPEDDAEIDARERVGLDEDIPFDQFKARPTMVKQADTERQRMMAEHQAMQQYQFQAQMTAQYQQQQQQQYQQLQLQEAMRRTAEMERQVEAERALRAAATAKQPPAPTPDGAVRRRASVPPPPSQQHQQQQAQAQAQRKATPLSLPLTPALTAMEVGEQFTRHDSQQQQQRGETLAKRIFSRSTPPSHRRPSVLSPREADAAAAHSVSTAATAAVPKNDVRRIDPRRRRRPGTDTALPKISTNSRQLSSRRVSNDSGRHRPHHSDNTSSDSSSSSSGSSHGEDERDHSRSSRSPSSSNSNGRTDAKATTATPTAAAGTLPVVAAPPTSIRNHRRIAAPGTAAAGAAGNGGGGPSKRHLVGLVPEVTGLEIRDDVAGRNGIYLPQHYGPDGRPIYIANPYLSAEQQQRKLKEQQQQDRLATSMNGVIRAAGGGGGRGVDNGRNANNNPASVSQAGSPSARDRRARRALEPSDSELRNEELYGTAAAADEPSTDSSDTDSESHNASSRGGSRSANTIGDDDEKREDGNGSRSVPSMLQLQNVFQSDLADFSFHGMESLSFRAEAPPAQQQQQRRLGRSPLEADGSSPEGGKEGATFSLPMSPNVDLTRLGQFQERPAIKPTPSSTAAKAQGKTSTTITTTANGSNSVNTSGGLTASQRHSAGDLERNGSLSQWSFFDKDAAASSPTHGGSSSAGATKNHSNRRVRPPQGTRPRPAPLLTNVPPPQASASNSNEAPEESAFSPLAIPRAQATANSGNTNSNGSSAANFGRRGPRGPTSNTTAAASSSSLPPATPDGSRATDYTTATTAPPASAVVGKKASVRGSVYSAYGDMSLFGESVFSGPNAGWESSAKCMSDTQSQTQASAGPGGPRRNSYSSARRESDTDAPAAARLRANSAAPVTTLIPELSTSGSGATGVNPSWSNTNRRQPRLSRPDNQSSTDYFNIDHFSGVEFEASRNKRAPMKINGKNNANANLNLNNSTNSSGSSRVDAVKPSGASEAGGSLLNTGSYSLFFDDDDDFGGGGDAARTDSCHRVVNGGSPPGPALGGSQTDFDY